MNDEFVNYLSGCQFFILSLYYYFIVFERLVNVVYMYFVVNEYFFWRNEFSIFFILVCCDIYQYGVFFVILFLIFIFEKVKEFYQCDQCGKIFKIKYILVIYLKMLNYIYVWFFVCNMCGKGF